MTKAFVSWSGGKDCCLALYRAKKSGLDISRLVNMVHEDGLRSCSHGMSAAVIKQQAEALGIEIAQRRTTPETYESVFIDLLKELNREGIETGVFGDIDFNPHREWIEKVCKAGGVTFQLPLWLQDQTMLLEEFLDAGFTTIVVAVRSDLLGKEALGMTVNREFLKYITGLNKGITPCGEAGEFHTLVIDGPIFKKRLEIGKTEKVTRLEHHFLEIKELKLKDKTPAGRK
jgi:diphthine-ammonia ligase